MSIGAGILLFAIGAILTFALDVQVDWIDLDMVGYILMGAGFIVFIIGLVLVARRRRSDTFTRTQVDPATGDRVTRQRVEHPDDTL